MAFLTKQKTCRSKNFLPCVIFWTTTNTLLFDLHLFYRKGYGYPPDWGRSGVAARACGRRASPTTRTRGAGGGCPSWRAACSTATRRSRAAWTTLRYASTRRNPRPTTIPKRPASNCSLLPSAMNNPTAETDVRSSTKSLMGICRSVPPYL